MLLAVDVGGTFLKTGLVDSDSGSISRIERHLGPPLRMGALGEAEINPHELIAAIRQSIDRRIANAGDVSGVLLTGQMHGWVMTSVDGVPVSPVVTWRDSYKSNALNKHEREDPLFRVKELLGVELIARSGNELRMGIPAVSLFARVADGLTLAGNSLHTITSFVASQLTQTCSSYPIHLTDAAALGLLNVRTKDWDSEIIDRLGFRQLNLPDPVDELTSVGVIPHLDVPLYVPIGDQQAALLGFQLRSDELSLNIATGSQVSRITRLPNPESQIRPYFGDSYLSTFTHIPAGRALNVLVNAFARFTNSSESSVWQHLAINCGAVYEKSPIFVRPTFFASPYGDTAEISGISETSFDFEFIFAGAIDWMTETYLDCAHKLDPNQEIAKVAVTGGLGTQIPYLRRRLTEAFHGCELRFFDGEDASLAGLAQLVQLGLIAG